MRKTDSSLFATLRVVAIMIGIDGRIAPQEQKWFQHIIKTSSLSDEQEKQLLADLKSPPLLEDIFPLIRLPGDREQLIRLARIAMQIDGDTDQKEQDFLNRLLDLNSKHENLDINYAIEIIKHTERLETWKKLEALGRGLRGRVRFPGWPGSVIIDPPPKKRKK